MSQGPEKARVDFNFLDTDTFCGIYINLEPYGF
jgi:hypothetical protein